MYKRKFKRNFSKTVPKKTKNYVQKAIRNQVETKFYPVVGQTAISTVDYTTGVFGQLSGGIASGTLNNQRIGSSIKPQGCKIDINVTLGAVPTQCQGRILILQDKENHSVDPVITDIFASTGGAVVSVSGFNAATVPTRYKVIRDLKFTLDTVDKTQWRHTVHLKRKEMNMIHYENVATYGKGQLYIVMVSNLLNTANTTPMINWGSRLAFDDA